MSGLPLLIGNGQKSCKSTGNVSDWQANLAQLDKSLIDLPV